MTFVSNITEEIGPTFEIQRRNQLQGSKQTLHNLMKWENTQKPRHSHIVNLSPNCIPARFIKDSLKTIRPCAFKIIQRVEDIEVSLISTGWQRAAASISESLGTLTSLTRSTNHIEYNNHSCLSYTSHQAKQISWKTKPSIHH